VDKRIDQLIVRDLTAVNDMQTLSLALIILLNFTNSSHFMNFQLICFNVCAFERVLTPILLHQKYATIQISEP
jgi:hypothetical protein